MCIPLVLLSTSLPAPSAPCQLRSKERLHGMCAAHAAALQSAVQLAGGLTGCRRMLAFVVEDLLIISRNCEALLTDGSLLALFSEALVQLADILPLVGPGHACRWPVP